MCGADCTDGTVMLLAVIPRLGMATRLLGAVIAITCVLTDAIMVWQSQIWTGTCLDAPRQLLRI